MLLGNCYNQLLNTQTPRQTRGYSVANDRRHDDNQQLYIDLQLLHDEQENKQ